MSPLTKRQIEPYLLLLPALIYLLLFFAWPMLQAFGLALRSDEGVWTLEHIRRMTGDQGFNKALVTTIVLLITLIPLQFIVALSMALLVNAHLKGSTLFLYFFAIPLAVSDLAAGIIWFSIFTERGYLNSLMQSLGIFTKPFIFINPEQPGWIILAIVIAEVWRATSIIMVILVAGLQSISRDYLEAAEIFGAGLLDRVRYVILPMLKPSLQVALILRTILAFQAFAVVIAIAGRATTVLAAESYRWYLDIRNPHVAAAFAGLILLLSIGMTAFYLATLRTPEETFR